MAASNRLSLRVGAVDVDSTAPTFTAIRSGIHTREIGVKLSQKHRALMFVATVALSSAYFLPVWSITLDAPQYPEGLGLHIWIDDIRGHEKHDLNKINNLNHYIGMREIHPESIPELRWMPYILGGLIGFGLLVVIAQRRWLLGAWLVVFALVSVVGLVDYYKWGYDYGHNLDTENAAIKFPGMTYQPPLIGSKKILNFTATSLPAVGGWIMISSFLLAAFSFFLSKNKNKLNTKER